MKKHSLVFSLSFFSLICNAAFDHSYHEASNTVKAKEEHAISRAPYRQVGPLSTDWAALDNAMGIPKNKQLPKTLEGNSGGTVLVHTKNIDAFDIMDLLESVQILRTAGYTPIVAMPKPFMIFMQSRLNDYGATQIPAGTPTETDYETHLISLIGRYVASCATQKEYSMIEQALTKKQQ